MSAAAEVAGPPDSFSWRGFEFVLQEVGDAQNAGAAEYVCNLRANGAYVVVWTNEPGEWRAELHDKMFDEEGLPSEAIASARGRQCTAALEILAMTVTAVKGTLAWFESRLPCRPGLGKLR